MLITPVYLLVSGNTSVDRSVHHPIERHAEQVDIAVQLLVLVLANKCSQLLVFVLHHREGIFQGANLHLVGRDRADGGKGSGTE